MPPDSVEIPDPIKASESVRAWALADARLSFLLTSSTSQSSALVHFGLWLLQENRSVDAATVFRAAIAFEPNDASMWTNLAVALDRTGATIEAAACLEYSIALQSQQPEAWLLLGTVRFKSGDRRGAEAAYRTALEQDPGLTMAYQCLGLIKQEQREYAAAIDFFTISLKRGGATAKIQANLGRICYQVGRFAEAHQAYMGVRELGETDPTCREMLRKSRLMVDLIGGASPDEAVAVYRQSRTAEGSDDGKENLYALLEGAFTLLIGFGHTDAAKLVGHKCLELRPQSHTLSYLVQALKGDGELDRAPAAYVLEHFDEFADGFDTQLVDVLGYDIPEKIGAAVRAIVEPGRLYDVLDAGCGTGLCGPELRPMARQLTGVDLSPKMLARAERRKIYDKLICEELTAFLGHSKDRYDLVIAGDVMIYFGDLRPLMRLAAKVIRPGGWFAFSTELLAGDGYRILRNGRFAHAPDYVRSMAGATFTECYYVETTTRLEATQRVPGSLFVFRRR